MNKKEKEKEEIVSTYFADIHRKVETEKIFSGDIPITIPYNAPFNNPSEQYMYGLACIEEFFKLYIQKDKSIRDKALLTMTDILIEIGKKRSMVTTLLLKEITIIEKHLNLQTYILIKLQIDKINPELSQQIGIDITNLSPKKEESDG